MFSNSCPQCRKKFQKYDAFIMCSQCGFQLSTRKIERSIVLEKVFTVLCKLLIPCIILAIIAVPIVYLIQNCKIGTVTENGGVIFFDKMHYSDGWRYLEVSPKTLDATLWAETKNTKVQGELYSDVGKGDRNSYTIVNRFGAKSAGYKAIAYGDEWYLGNNTEMKWLNLFANFPILKNKLSKLEDFDPIVVPEVVSEEEQNEENAEPKEETKPKNEVLQYYWTSEILDPDTAYCYDFTKYSKYPSTTAIFDIKSEDGTVYKARKLFVRPIRKF